MYLAVKRLKRKNELKRINQNGLKMDWKWIKNGLKNGLKRKNNPNLQKSSTGVYDKFLE